MKTQLPESINTIEEAIKFYAELSENQELYHPEDDAHDILWQTAKVSPKECDQLNKLRDDVYNLDGVPEVWDPCDFLLSQPE